MKHFRSPLAEGANAVSKFPVSDGCCFGRSYESGSSREGREKEVQAAQESGHGGLEAQQMSVDQ